MPDDEPQILTPETHADAVDVPVDDLETIELTRAELDEREQKAKGRGWQLARKHYRDKARQEALAAFGGRVEKLEQLLAIALPKIFPGLDETLKGTK